jgi:hypothetical protein
MSAQQQLKLPSKVSPESASKNAKFQLRNAITDWLDTNKLGWSATIVENHGRNFISLLSDILWHIDGHHSTLRSRSCCVPVMFSGFVGYNRPEKRKGRRRGPDSMSQAVLDLQSQALLETIQQPWILTHKWAGVREALKQLADSLSKYMYSKYLCEKRVEVNENHNLSVPVRQMSQDGVSEKLVVISRARFVKPTLASRHRGLQEALYRTENYTPLYLNDFVAKCE